MIDHDSGVGAHLSEFWEDDILKPFQEHPRVHRLVVVIAVFVLIDRYTVQRVRKESTRSRSDMGHDEALPFPRGSFSPTFSLFIKPLLIRDHIFVEPGFILVKNNPALSTETLYFSNIPYSSPHNAPLFTQTSVVCRPRAASEPHCLERAPQR